MSLKNEQQDRESVLHDECVKVLKAFDRVSPEVRQSAHSQMIAKTASAIAECEGATTESKVSFGQRFTKHGIDKLDIDFAHGASTWVVGASLFIPNMPKSNTQNLLEWEIRYLLKQAGASQHVISNFPVFNSAVEARAIEAIKCYEESAARAKAMKA